MICKTYQSSYNLDRHIREKHDLVKYTCNRCLKSYSRQYNLRRHLTEDCVAKVGSTPIIRIQTVKDWWGYNIPKLTADSVSTGHNPVLTDPNTTMDTPSDCPHKKREVKDKNAGKRRGNDIRKRSPSPKGPLKMKIRLTDQASKNTSNLATLAPSADTNATPVSDHDDISMDTEPAVPDSSEARIVVQPPIHMSANPETTGPTTMPVEREMTDAHITRITRLADGSFVDFSTPRSDWDVEEGAEQLEALLEEDTTVVYPPTSSTPAPNLVCGDLELSDSSSNSSMETIYDDNRMYELYHQSNTTPPPMTVDTETVTQQTEEGGKTPSSGQGDNQVPDDRRSVVVIVLPKEEEEQDNPDIATPTRILIGELLRDLEKISVIENPILLANLEGVLERAHDSFTARMALMGLRTTDLVE
jgi:hypothetical protein